MKQCYHNVLSFYPILEAYHVIVLFSLVLLQVFSLISLLSKLFDVNICLMLCLSVRFLDLLMDLAVNTLVQ